MRGVSLDLGVFVWRRNSVRNVVIWYGVMWWYANFPFSSSRFEDKNLDTTLSTELVERNCEVLELIFSWIFILSVIIMLSATIIWCGAFYIIVFIDREIYPIPLWYYRSGMHPAKCVRQLHLLAVEVLVLAICGAELRLVAKACVKGI